MMRVAKDACEALRCGVGCFKAPSPPASSNGAFSFSTKTKSSTMRRGAPAASIASSAFRGVGLPLARGRHAYPRVVRDDALGEDACRLFKVFVRPRQVEPLPEDAVPD